MQSEAPLYALQEVADPLQNGHLLANHRLGPVVGGAEHGKKLPLVNSKNDLAILTALQSGLSRKTYLL